MPFQYVPSCVSESCLGQPSKSGQPLFECVPVRLPVESRFSARANAAVDAVIGAVCQGVRGAVPAPRPSAVEQSAQEFEGGEVDVCVHEAPDLAPRAPGARRRAVDVHRVFRGTRHTRQPGRNATADSDCRSERGGRPGDRQVLAGRRRWSIAAPHRRGGEHPVGAWVGRAGRARRSPWPVAAGILASGPYSR